MALEGTLKDFSLADIFQLIGLQGDIVRRAIDVASPVNVRMRVGPADSAREIIQRDHGGCP